MKATIETLFDYMEREELDQFRDNLRADVVNMRRVSKIAPYVRNTKRVYPVSFGEIHYELLLFRAMWLKSYDAFKLLLECDADLLLMEKFDCTDVQKTYQGQPIPECQPKETNIALTCVTNSFDPKLIQITFDHICRHALYNKPIFVDFLLQHLRGVNLEKFRPEFLKFGEVEEVEIEVVVEVEVEEVRGVDKVEKEVEEKAPPQKIRARSPERDDGVQQPIPIRPQDQQEYDHLEKKRLPLVQSAIRALTGKAKLSSKERAELKAAQISLADCMSRFHANPVYKKKKMEEALKLLPDPPEEHVESDYQQGSPSI